MIAVLVVLRCAWIFAALLRSHGVPLGLAQDDFYYYLRPAQNLAWHGHSTFFLNVSTNGYHPLYFLLLVVVSFSIKTLPGIFRFLWVLDTVSASAIFFLTRSLMRKVCGEWLANGVAVLMTALCFTQICDQMEVTLALPFGFAFLLAMFAAPAALTPRRLLVAGLLGALTFLSRLDAGLLVFFSALGMLCLREYREVLTPARAGAFLGGCLPLPLVYLGINRHFFSTWLPISGMSKELRHGHHLSILLPGSFSGTSEALVNVAVITAILGLALRRYLKPQERMLLFACVVTPFVFYGLEMVISDWPVWNWYFYVLRFPALAAGVLFAAVATREVVPRRYPRLRRSMHSPILAMLLVVAALLKLYRAQYKVDAWMLEIQHASEVLDQFAAVHPGIYAMGDRAGMFAVTTPNPVLQTEGLVMDKPYLEHIRRQDDLRSTLASYGVRYYVAFVFERNYSRQFRDGCFVALEPSIAGPDASRMRSDFCEPPLMQFAGFDGKYMIFPVSRDQSQRRH